MRPSKLPIVERGPGTGAENRASGQFPNYVKRESHPSRLAARKKKNPHPLTCHPGKAVQIKRETPSHVKNTCVGGRVRQKERPIATPRGMGRFVGKKDPAWKERPSFPTSNSA